jgi:hypothetical protein
MIRLSFTKIPFRNTPIKWKLLVKQPKRPRGIRLLTSYSAKRKKKLLVRLPKFKP